MRTTPEQKAELKKQKAEDRRADKLAARQEKKDEKKALKSWDKMVAMAKSKDAWDDN